MSTGHEPSGSPQDLSELSESKAVADDLCAAEVDVGSTTRRIVVFMSAVYAFLLFCDYHVNFASWTEISSIRRLFNMTREDGLGSWIAVTQVTLLAITLWFIYALLRSRGAGKWRCRGWLLMAAFFSYMSFDDGTKFHERYGTAFRVIQERGEVSGDHRLGRALLELFPSYSWQAIFLPFFGAMGLFVLWFMWRELQTRRSRILVLLAISMFVVAVGLDFVEGLEPDHRFNLYSWIEQRIDLRDFARDRFTETPFEMLRHFSKAIEEVIEMAGVTILWVVFLQYLGRIGGTTQLRFVGWNES